MGKEPVLTVLLLQVMNARPAEPPKGTWVLSADKSTAQFEQSYTILFLTC